jgi:dienelactone hydrolase
MTPRSALSCLLALLALWPAALRAEGLGVGFVLTKPAGDGPFPAVVILHDCSGLGPRSSGAPWRWSSDLTRHGYVTLWPDSFTTRNHPNGQCTDPTLPRVSYRQRASDAYAALAHLRTLPFVDPRRIAVMGGSHGGSSTLATIVASPENAAQAHPGFAAAVALYPGCGINLGAWKVRRGKDRKILGYDGAFKPLAPLLILSGELDDWTPAEPCRRLAEAARAAGYPVDIKIYPGAHHSFDSIAPIRYRAERLNRNSPTGHGATTGGNAEAWADAVRQVVQFLGNNLAK